MVTAAIFSAVFFLAGFPNFLHATNFVLNATDAIGTNSFNTGLHWPGGAAPAANNTYQTTNFLLRTPAVSTPVTFAGDSLEIQSGGELRHKTGHIVTVSNLIAANTAILDLTAPTGGNTGALAGTLTLNGTATLRAGIQASESANALTIAASVVGAGGFTTAGSFGTITFTGTNSFSGGATVNGGTVLVNGIFSSSSVLVTSGTLGGNGVIKGAITNQISGTLQPGLGSGDTSTLTVSNNVMLGGTSLFSLNRTNAQNSSRIKASGTVAFGGTLTVANNGPALLAGDSFTLYNAAGLTGNFGATNLPALSGGLAWSNSLAQNGVITVISLTTNLGVANLPATQVLATSATLNGQLLSTGGQAPNVWIFYGTNNGGTNTAAWSNSVSLGVNSNVFSATVSSLATNTLHYFTALASNATAVAWATPSQSFTTLAANPVTTRVPMLTYHNDNSRQGQNTNETLLTLANVNTNTFGKLFSYAVDGYVYSQPLYMTNVTIPGKGVHNVVFIATEHDTVYAFDADNNSGTNNGLLWSTNLGIASLNTLGPYGRRYTGVNNPFTDITPEVGMTGTPVIDPVTGTLYVNAFTREPVGAITNYVHRIHALDITTGGERLYSPVVVTGAVPGMGVDSVGGVMTFNAIQNNQRAALTLAGGRLYVAYAGYADTDPYHGWLFGYNATNLVLQTNYVFNTTPNASIAAFGSHAAEGGIWQGGAGLCADTNNNLYFETGNGSFSANTNGGDYSDSFMKISTANGLTVADYFTPFDQLALAIADTDLGACGPLLLPDSVGSATHPHLLAGMGKSGKVYLIDRDTMTTGNVHYQAGSDSQIVQSFDVLGNSWAPPSYWNGFLYCQPSSGAMASFSIANGTFNTTATATAAASFGQYNGGPVISSSGTNNGIVWALNNNSASTSAAGTLYAFNATNISQMLYSSAQLPARDSMGNGCKMTTPTVAGGKVYVPGQFTLTVYGVQVFLDTPIISPNGGNFVNTVNVAITDASVGVSIYYTLDGTTPTASSILYTGPFTLTSNAVVRAVAVQAGSVNSAIASASFVNTAAPGNGTGLKAEYFANHTSASPFTGSPTLTTTNPTVNFTLNTNWPGASIGSNNFTVRWTGCVQPQFTENFNFITTADDGVRLFINGQLLIDDWADKTNATSKTNSISLVAQQFYNVELDYYQKTNSAGAQLSWSSPSVPVNVVPQTQLYPFTNPPPSVVLISPANGASYTAAASVTISADADEPNNPISGVSFYANNVFLGSVSNAPYTLTATSLAAGNYALTAVATDTSGLSSTTSVVNITINVGSGQPYGLTNNPLVKSYLNMPTTSAGSLPALLSLTGIYSNTPSMTVTSGVIAYDVNTPLWSDGALKSRFMAIPNNGTPLTVDEQISFSPTNYWTFPAGSVFVKTFELNTDTTNPNVKRRLETRVLVRDINGAVYGVTYKWRADNSDADLLASSLTENILITNATGVSSQAWYYPSPSDCLTCHTPVGGYVLGVNTRQLNRDFNHPTGVTDNQLRTLNRLGKFNTAFDETGITNLARMYALTNLTASAEARARSYLDANCMQCHQPGGTGPTFDARYDTPLANQNLVYGGLDADGLAMIVPKDIWRSEIPPRMNTTNPAVRMPPLGRSLIDSNAVQVMYDWINSLPGTPAQAPPVIAPNGGNYFNSIGVALTAPDTNALIYYTLDGSAPTTNSLLYNGAFTLTTNATIAASAFRTNYINSLAATALFFITPVQFTSANFTTNRQFSLGFVGVPGSNYVLQASTNLSAWVSISTNAATTNSFLLLDPKATNFPYRFYRVLQQ